MENEQLLYILQDLRYTRAESVRTNIPNHKAYIFKENRKSHFPTVQICAFFIL